MTFLEGYVVKCTNVMYFGLVRGCLELVLHLFDACHLLDFGSNVSLLFVRSNGAVQRDFAIVSVKMYFLNDGVERHVPIQSLPNALVERAIGFGGGFVLHAC